MGVFCRTPNCDALGLTARSEFQCVPPLPSTDQGKVERPIGYQRGPSQDRSSTGDNADRHKIREDAVLSGVAGASLANNPGVHDEAKAALALPITASGIVHAE